MKKIIFIIGAVLITPVMTFGTVLAYTVSDSATGSTSSPNTTRPEDTTTPPSEETLRKHIEDNKLATKTKLDEASKKRIMAKCKPAQGKAKGAETSITAIIESRDKAFNKISEAVQKVIDKLKAAGKDTTELEADLAVAKQKSAVLTADIATYRQTLAELQALDCVTDPTAFQATLVTARLQRDTAKAAAVDLRTYISTTLKTALNKVKSQLESDKPKSESTDKSTTTPTTTGGQN